MTAGEMPLQNRVDPFGELIATPARGLFMGNRGGRFHSDDKTLTDAALGVAAVDLLRARVQGPPSRCLGPLLHRVVLPRRGRPRSPPATGPASSAGARMREAFAECWQQAFRLRARPRAAAMDAVCMASGSMAAPSATHRRGIDDLPDGALSRSMRAPSRCAATRCCAGRQQGYDFRMRAAARRRSRRAHAAGDRSLCSRRLPAALARARTT